MTESIESDVGSNDLIASDLIRRNEPGPRVPLIAADRDHDARRLDAVAGCEFLDDRIRRRE